MYMLGVLLIGPLMKALNCIMYPILKLNTSVLIIIIEITATN